MSDKTKQAMEEAIRAHYADEIKDGMMTEYFATIGGVLSKEDANQYIYEGSHTAIHSLVGLARMGSKFIEEVANSDEDDE